MTNGFPRSARLVNAADFNGVFRGDNKRFGNHYWTALVTIQPAQTDANVADTNKSTTEGVARLGLAIAKKRARRAVDRNRLKRQARESFRLHRLQLGAVDIVIMNRDSAAAADNEALRRKLEELWVQIASHSSKAAPHKHVL